MKILSSGDINNYANDIFCLLKEIPLFYYVKEVLELANEEREKEGEIYNIDTSSDEEEEGISKFANSESYNESDEDD